MGGASFFVSCAMKSESFGNRSTNFMSTLTVDRTTAAFACANLGEIRSQMFWASLSSLGRYPARASRMKT